MNTKFFFLLLISLLITNTTSSFVHSKREGRDLPASQTNNDNTAKKHSPYGKEDIALNDLTSDHNSAEKTHKGHEDGKFHHFHFSRVGTKRRRKALHLFASKLILVFAHVACFIYCFMHVFH